MIQYRLGSFRVSRDYPFPKTKQKKRSRTHLLTCSLRDKTRIFGSRHDRVGRWKSRETYSARIPMINRSMNMMMNVEQRHLTLCSRVIFHLSDCTVWISILYAARRNLDPITFGTGLFRNFRDSPVAGLLKRFFTNKTFKFQLSIGGGFI